MELKSLESDNPWVAMMSFNRTFMELKFGCCSWYFCCRLF